MTKEDAYEVKGIFFFIKKKKQILSLQSTDFRQLTLINIFKLLQKKMKMNIKRPKKRGGE